MIWLVVFRRVLFRSSASGTDALCFGGTGTITASAVGGSGAYQFKLDGGAFQAGGNFSGVTVGPHTVTVQDANSCAATKDRKSVEQERLTASASGTDALCFGGTGTITASAVGGSGAYQFKLDGG